MNLDCIEGSETREVTESWIIIDHDNNSKEFATGCSIGQAWQMAAARLERRVNDATDTIEKARIILEA